MPDLDSRIRAKAEHLWKEAGQPSGGPEAYREQASELVAIEDNTSETLEPNPLAETPRPDDAEPLRAVRNVGEQPNLTGQGETRDYPEPRGERTGRQARSAERERNAGNVKE